MDLVKKLKKGTVENKSNRLINNSPYVPYGEREPFTPAGQDMPIRDFPRQANVEMGNVLARTKNRKMMKSKKVNY